MFVSPAAAECHSSATREILVPAAFSPIAAGVGGGGSNKSVRQINEGNCFVLRRCVLQQIYRRFVSFFVPIYPKMPFILSFLSSMPLRANDTVSFFNFNPSHMPTDRHTFPRSDDLPAKSNPPAAEPPTNIRSVSFKMMKLGSSFEDPSGNLTLVEMALPLRGFRQYVALTYFACNLLGLFANSWVLFVVGPLLWMPNVRVPKSILFHILALCVSDLATMCAMVLLNLEIFCGTWRLGSMSCTAYLLFDSMNKFSAPIIVLLISRTCYSTVCLDKRRQQSAASLKMAFVQVLVSLCLVLVLLWPLFAYSEVSSMPIRVDNATRRLLFIRKCAFVPPPSVESVFNIVVCIVSYAIPFAGFLYWYASVPFFLWRKKEHLMASQQSSSGTAARGQQSSTAVIRRVVLTVLVLALVYLVCWTPYWLGIFARRLLNLRMSPKQSVITMYFVHLMPYVSCAAYPAIFTLLNRPIRSAHSHWKRSMQRRIQQSRLARRLRDVLGSYECHQIGGVRKGSHPVRHHAQKQDVPRRSTMSAGEGGKWNKEAALLVDSRGTSEMPVPPVRDESKADTGFEEEGTSWHEEEDVIL